MKKTEIGKTKLEARALGQKKLFQSVIKIIAIDKAVATFGEKSVKWAINKYLTQFVRKIGLSAKSLLPSSELPS